MKYILNMSSFIQTFLMGIAGLIFLSWLFSRSSGWDELSQKYKTEQCSPIVFIDNQQGIFKNPDDNRGSTVIRPLNIGVSEEGMYLFLPFPYDVFYPSLLIPWDEIEYKTPHMQDDENKRHTFYIGNPVITRLRLYPKAIEKLEEDYGEPIFSNKLGELS